MKYTEQANQVLKIARDTAKKLNHPYVGTEHLLLGLREVYTGVAGSCRKWSRGRQDPESGG